LTIEKPNNFTAELFIKTEASSVRVASGWLTDNLSSAGIPDSQSERLVVCLNEALANIIEHGGESALRFPILVRVELNSMQHTNKASVIVCDSGIPFNPILGEQKKPPSSLDEVKPGGLGLTMMRAFVDELRYDYIKNAFNQLSFSIYWENQSS
jgi:serine/threonine-protein kinase RsbW